MTTPAKLNPLGRFSDRVADYVRYRPTYPAALLARLDAKAGLARGAAVADVGSGTGIFSRLLLEAGARVWAVEPNAAMRAAAEAELGGHPNFTSVDGAAEATGLADGAVSLVTCAQAFHWFDPAAARREFRRILAPGGRCALVWNTAVVAGSEFAAGYERIKSEFGTDFHRVRHENIARGERFAIFFGAQAWEEYRFENFQVLDYPGLEGRLRSSSYAPKENDPRYGPMMAALKELFDRCQEKGVVRMDYQAELFLGRLD